MSVIVKRRLRRARRLREAREEVRAEARQRFMWGLLYITLHPVNFFRKILARAEIMFEQTGWKIR